MLQVLWNLQATPPQWHTSSNKTTPPTTGPHLLQQGHTCTNHHSEPWTFCCFTKQDDAAVEWNVSETRRHQLKWADTDHLLVSRLECAGLLNAHRSMQREAIAFYSHHHHWLSQGLSVDARTVAKGWWGTGCTWDLKVTPVVLGEVSLAMVHLWKLVPSGMLLMTFLHSLVGSGVMELMTFKR